VETAEPQALQGLHPCPDPRDSQQRGRPVTHRLCGRHVSPLDDAVKPIVTINVLPGNQSLFRFCDTSPERAVMTAPPAGAGAETSD
jgi:hypothetical protein